MDKSMTISPRVSIPYGRSLLFEQQKKSFNYHTVQVLANMKKISKV